MLWIAGVGAILLGVTADRALPPSVVSERDGTVRYFAFGSNLLRSKMDGRGDTQVVACTAASVADHRLAFNMRMFPPIEPSMASIEPSPGSTCEGALYTLTREGYEALWRSEGGSMSKPGYEEIVVQCTTTDDGATVDAITLRAAPWMRLACDAPPSSRYKQLIVDGAREIGLSDAYISRLAEIRAASASPALVALARAHGVVAVLLFRLKLRALLAPYRAACYAALRIADGGGALGVRSRRVRQVASELAMGALFLPTAVVGASIRALLRLIGKERWVQFGPPPSRPQSAPKDAGETTTSSRPAVVGSRAEV